MAQENLNTSTPNSGLGDFLRSAFVKVQNMFTELYSGKIDKEVGKGLSANDFTGVLKNKLDNIAGFAEVNVQADFNQADNTQDNFIKNKPVIPVFGDLLLNGGFVGTANDLAPKASPTFTGTVSGITKAMVGLGNVDNTSDANKPVSTAEQTALNLKINLTEKGAVNGVVPLDSGAKILSTYFPDSILGNLKFGGTYNGSVISASASFPELQGLNLPTSGFLGIYFITTTAFTRASVTYDIGDWVLHNGSDNYVKVDNTDAVTTVFGRLGNILANSGDYASFYSALGHVHAIADVTGLQAGLNLKANDNSVVKLTGAQTIADLKTFTTPILSDGGADFRASGSGIIQAVGLTVESENGGVPKVVLKAFGHNTSVGGFEFRHLDGSGNGNIVSAFANSLGNWSFFRQVFARGQVAFGTYTFDGIPNTDVEPVTNTALTLGSGSEGKSLFTHGSAIFSGALTGTSANFSGNVSLGAIAPLEKLSIDTGNIRFNSEAGVAGVPFGEIIAGFDNNNVGASISFVRGNPSTWASEGEIRFRTAVGDDNILRDRMAITKEGNVGIGTTNPTARLDVAGSSNFSGFANFGNTPTFNSAAGIFSGYMAGHTGTTIQSFLSIVRSGQELGTQGMILGVNQTTGLLFVRDNLPFSIGTNNTIRFTIAAGGNATFTGSVTATSFPTSSDIRLKDLVEPYDYTQLANLNPITFQYKNRSDDLNHYGYSAQDVQEVMPYAVIENEDGFLSVNYTEVLVAKVKYLEDKLSALELRLQALEAS